MGIAKTQMERENYKFQIATEIAIAADVLDSCEIHGVTFHSEGSLKSAYALGQTLWSKRLDVQDIFADRREMTDFIKISAEHSDHANLCCEECQSYFF